MPKRKKRKETVVATPILKREEEALLRDTAGVEALDVFKLSGKVGKYLSYLMMAVGALLIFSAGSIFASVQFSFPKPLFIGALALLGALNTLCGLILLSKE